MVEGFCYQGGSKVTIAALSKDGADEGNHA